MKLRNLTQDDLIFYGGGEYLEIPSERDETPMELLCECIYGEPVVINEFAIPSDSYKTTGFETLPEPEEGTLLILPKSEAIECWNNTGRDDIVYPITWLYSYDDKKREIGSLVFMPR